jgi:hypothetical protein
MQDERYIYETLLCLDRHDGGRATPGTVYDEVRAACRAELTAYDFGDLNSGGKRFPNKIRFIRQALIEFGLVEPKRARGEWQITDLGRKYLKPFPHVELGPGRAVSIVDEEII